MANPFKQIPDVKSDLKKHNYDWSHTYNFTANMGKIIPVFCEQMPAGSSIKINPTFGLKFMPMAFPVQSKIKAYLSFYRVPLRALWKDYADFISSPNSESTLIQPYLSSKGYTQANFRKGAIMGVSGISDYLGVPVTYSYPAADGLQPITTINPKAKRALRSEISRGVVLTISTNYDASTDKSRYWAAYPVCYNVSSGKAVQMFRLSVNLDFSSDWSKKAIDFITKNADSFRLVTGNYTVDDTLKIDYMSYLIQDNEHIIVTPLANGRTQVNLIFDCPIPKNGYAVFITPSDSAILANDFTLMGANDTVNPPFTVGPSTSAQMIGPQVPYFGFCSSQENTDKLIKLSAYPYRAYEAIYNGYIRNIRNNPFKIDGKPTYNKYIPNDEGGADSYAYDLYNANWASDAYTTAVPSPQQGVAPLVGLTTYESVTTTAEGQEVTKLNTALVDEDGNKYGVEFQSDNDGLTGVNYTALDPKTKVESIQNLYTLVTSGISINDFRNVNAYQRYLELNMMKGYSYRQIVEGRFNCNVHYDTLLLPEYLGGITRDVVINPITQSVQINDSGYYVDSLGSQAGQAQCVGSSDVNITGFNDEESIVMGILYVVPMPIYTQTLPKHFLYRDRLDSFNPEFDQIGYQPIRTKELCPVNQWLQDPLKMDDVFGYQRPWYEYVMKNDTAHGLFRTELRNFIINRVFSGVPQLGKDFTTVSQDSVNDVFSVQDVNDKILGQIYFDCTAKLPISRVVIPKID